MTQHSTNPQMEDLSVFINRRAKKWYSCSVGSIEGSWEKLREKFCLTFFPMSRVVTIRLEILSFKQLDKESLGTTWEQFTNSLASGPDLGISEPILLQHFRMGLDVESAKFWIFHLGTRSLI
jgi:hypothetical protein